MSLFEKSRFDWRRFSTRKKLAILAPLVLIAIVVGIVTTQNRNDTITFHYAPNITLTEGSANWRSFDLAKGQKLTVYFQLEPEDAEIVVMIGCVTKEWGQWKWVGQPKEFPRVKDGSKIEFKAPHTNPYTMWMKPRWDYTVKVKIAYRFSE